MKVKVPNWELSEYVINMRRLKGMPMKKARKLYLGLESALDEGLIAPVRDRNTKQVISYCSRESATRTSRSVSDKRKDPCLLFNAYVKRLRD